MKPWIDSAGRWVYLHEMTIQHINNTIVCLKGEGKSIIPEIHAGLTREKWIELFQIELNKRTIFTIFN